MHITRALAVGAVATLVATVPGAPAAAGPPDHAQDVTTYHGTWEGGTSGGTLPSDPCKLTSDMDGVWALTLKKDGTANFSMALFVNGGFYAAWGGNYWMHRFTWEPTDDGLVASLEAREYHPPMTFEVTFGSNGGTAVMTFHDLFGCGDGVLNGAVH